MKINQCPGVMLMFAVLAISGIFWAQNVLGQRTVAAKLTLAQIEQLVSSKVPDPTLSAQIQRRGLAFMPNQAIVESLRAKGVGPLTLAAVEARFASGGPSESHQNIGTTLLPKPTPSPATKIFNVGTTNPGQQQILAIPVIHSAEFNLEERDGLDALEYDKYDQAASHFARAASIEPTNPQALLYYGAAQAADVVPGLKSPANLKTAKNALVILKQVLALRPNDGYALNGIASIYFEIGELGAAKEALLRILAVEPRDFDADYEIGAIDWRIAYSTVINRINQEHLSIGEGDYPDVSPSVCRAISVSNASLIGDAMRHLKRALVTNPKDDDAMAYLNLVYRLRAGTHCSDNGARAADMEAAKTYREEAIAMRQSIYARPKIQSPQPASTLSLPNSLKSVLIPPPSPPPPPPPPPAAVQ